MDATSKSEENTSKESTSQGNTSQDNTSQDNILQDDNRSVLKHYSIASDIMWYIRHYRKYEPIVLVLCGIEIILKVMIPLIGIYLPKLAVDAVTNDWGREKAMIVLGLFTILCMLVNGLHGMVNSGKYHYYNCQRTILMNLLFLKSLRIRYEDVESGEIKKIYWKSIQSLEIGDWSCSSKMLTGTVSLICNVLCFILYSTVIGQLNFVMLVVIILLSLCNCFIGISRIRFEESIREEQAEFNKHLFCVRSSMGNTTAAKDIRMFGMANWLLDLRDGVLAESKKLDMKRAGRESMYEKIGFMVALVRDLGAYAYLIYQATNGNVTVSEFVLYFGAITGFSNFVQMIMNSVMDLRSAANDTDYVRTYMELPEEDELAAKVNEQIAVSAVAVNSVADLTLPVEIEFRNVSFSYKEADADKENEEENTPKKLLDNFNLKIHAGEKVALVGVNGAGKTTIVKLLCGLYDVDKGEILINGVNRNEFSRKELYQLFSVVFQEHLLMPFTIGENISMTRASYLDENRAWDALEKAGLKSVFEEKKITTKTYIGKNITEEGIELSGGQNQRLLLARALYKDAPVLILDEPTAALDPIAESEIYNSYANTSDGKTALFISHRLASTRFSDRIVMLEDGKIIEMGTHEELMERAGAYAQMFQIQSSYYEACSEALV